MEELDLFLRVRLSTTWLIFLQHRTRHLHHLLNAQEGVGREEREEEESIGSIQVATFMFIQRYGAGWGG